MFEKVILKLDSQNKAKGLTIDPSTIPTIAPQEHVARFQANDNSPYYKIQKIDFPVTANGMNYKRQFFDALLSHLKERPIPGSKEGHDMRWGVRAKTDLLLVGGKIEGSGETGSVYLKNYVPPKAESDNSNFIAECKADLVHFSLVAYAKKEIIQNEDGTITVNVLECGEQGLRNDAVSYGEGAMGQVTNADNIRILGKSTANARKLINAGKINTGSWSFSASDGDKLLGPNGDNWSNYALFHLVEVTDAEAESKGRYKYPYGKNGEVYTNALSAIASRAAQQGLTDLSDLASELHDLAKEKSKNKEGTMDKKQLLEALAQFGQTLTLPEVASAMGKADMLVNKQHEDALKVVNGLQALGLKDPVAEVTAMKAKIEQNQTIVRNAALDSAYGTDPEGKNTLRQYAEKMIPANCQDLGKAIEDLKKDTVALKLAESKADFMSDENAIGKKEANSKNDPDEIAVFEG